MIILTHASKITKFFAIRHTYSGVAVVDKVFQIEKGGVGIRFEVLQEEGRLLLLTLLSLQTVHEDLHGHLLVMVQSQLGILQHHFNDATPGAMGEGGWTQPDLDDFISYSVTLPPLLLLISFLFPLWGSLGSPISSFHCSVHNYGNDGHASL